MEIFRIAIVLPFLVLAKATSHPVRLSQPCSGVVEVLHQQVWKPLTFDNESAELGTVAQNICANLSCGAVYEFRQNGNATTNYSSSTCLSQCVYRDLRVENCTELSNSSCFNLTEITCGHGAVRLAGGTHHCKGRVELWRKDGWGTVCDDSWDLTDGSVVCAQLGCGFALHVSGQGGPFEAGVGLILLDEVNCSGSERNLWDCTSQTKDLDCGHKEDASVICSGIQEFDSQTVAVTSTVGQNSSTEASLVPDISAESRLSLVPAAVWGCISLSIALLFALICNALLFLSYKRRPALVVHQRQESHLSLQSQERVTLLTVTTATAPYPPQELPQQPSQKDTNPAFDYESEICDGPSVAMATALGSRAVSFTGCGRKPSLESSSTSSGECYENIETMENEFPYSGSREVSFTGCGRKPSLQSSSTSSGECYENIETMNVKDNPNVLSTVQSTITLQDQQLPGESICHLLSHPNQEYR
ncbi:hypothetical protein UPYG_G00149510 [Umbra pygmaea]|uniref:SRCR domain-containing protein n=1 Tax=Umbra pygmaea TaxID=75934 RepID=A0ABD0XLJ2_UMBPY